MKIPRDLVSKPESKVKPQFIVKKDILYRKYTSKQGDTKIQLVVPTEMREKVVLHTIHYWQDIEGRPKL